MNLKIRLPLVALLFTFLAVPALKAERPSAPKLLPYNTVVYLRVDDFPALGDDFLRTSFGNIRNDASVAPLVDRLYNEFLNAFPQVEDELGVSVEELMDLPTGEVALSLAVTDTGRPMFAFIADVGENVDTATTLLERAEFEHINNAGDLSEELIGDTEVTLFANPGDDDDVYSFIKEETVVLCSSELMATHLISVWEGTATEADRTLADNRKFTDIMRNSVGAEDFQPQISFFADPLTLIKSTTQDNFQAQAVLALLPTLGVDGFKAVGGSLIVGPPGFDTMAHFHLSLGSPRRGVFNLLTLGEGELNSEDWVSNEISNYGTMYWDLEAMYGELTKVVDSVLGSGYFENLVEENVNLPVGINLQEDVIAQVRHGNADDDRRTQTLKNFDEFFIFVDPVALHCIPIHGLRVISSENRHDDGHVGVLDDLARVVARREQDAPRERLVVELAHRLRREERPERVLDPRQLFLADGQRLVTAARGARAAVVWDAARETSVACVDENAAPPTPPPAASREGPRVAVEGDWPF